MLAIISGDNGNISLHILQHIDWALHMVETTRNIVQFLLNYAIFLRGNRVC